MKRRHLFAITAVTFAMSWLIGCRPVEQNSMSYADFVADVESGNVEYVTVQDGRLSVEAIKDATAEGEITAVEYSVVPPPGAADHPHGELLELLDEHDVPYMIRDDEHE